MRPQEGARPLSPLLAPLLETWWRLKLPARLVSPSRAAEKAEIVAIFGLMEQVEKYNGDIRGYKRELIKKMKAAEKQ